MRLLCALTIVYWCAGTPASAVDPNRAVTQYVRERWGNEQGFPNGPVYAITQTIDGYLWIGTEAGLVRFDGLNFKKMESRPALEDLRTVLGLTPDPDGGLWVRLRRPTLLRYWKGQFYNVMTDFGRPASSVSATTLAQNGQLLFWELDGEGNAVIRRGDRFETLASSTSLSRSPVLSVAQTSEGDVWLGTRDAGLVRLHNGVATTVTEGLPDPKVNCLLAGKNGELWAGTDRGVVRWDGEKLTSKGLPPLLREVRTLAIASDRDSNVWIGTNAHGLLRWNAAGVSALPPGEGGEREAVTALFEDREGNMWAGSAGGIERLSDSAFVTYSATEGLPSVSSGPIHVDGQKRTWFAPLGGGLYWMRDGKTARVMEGDVVYSIAGRGSEIWAGRQRGGLTRLREQGGTFAATTYTTRDGLAQDRVFCVYETRDGTVWAGTLSGGVSRFDGKRFQNLNTAEGLAASTVWAIAEASDGSMWFGTPAGLSVFANGKWRNYTRAEGLPADPVNALLPGEDGSMWVGPRRDWRW